MAGYWGHIVNDDGTPRFNFGAGVTMEEEDEYIDALGECYGMIWWLAGVATINSSEVVSVQPLRDRMLAVIEQARDNYQTGCRVGKGEQWRASAGTWRKGQKDPERGTSARHARQKAFMMLAAATDQQVRHAVRQLLETRPVEILDALLAVLGDDQ
jgi:hypothetical protein